MRSTRTSEGNFVDAAYLKFGPNTCTLDAKVVKNDERNRSLNDDKTEYGRVVRFCRTVSSFRPNRYTKMAKMINLSKTP